MQINLHRLPNGDFVNYGRHWRVFDKHGEGPSMYYAGEAAEVLELVLKHQDADNG